MNKKKKYNNGGLMPTSDFMAQQMNFVNQQQMPQTPQKTTGDRIANAAKYSALGAKLGTVIPGVGNVVGGLAGAGIGMLMANGGQINGLANNEPGQLTEFQGGGTHEENPNGGIPVGKNNLVEENETMTDFNSTKFVFSDRLKIPGKSKTFAAESKAIKNKVNKDRPHDKASKRTVERLLAKLADTQESLKAKKEKALQNKLSDLKGIGMPSQDDLATMTPEEQMYYGGQLGLPKVKILEGGGGADFTETKKRIDEDTLPDGYNPNLAMVGTLANALPGMYNVYRGLKKSAPINLERTKLSRINLGRQRQLVKDASAEAVKMNAENIRRIAPSSGAALSSLASTSAAINANTSKAIAESKLSEETTNIGIDNQQNSANAATANQEQDLRWRTEAAKQQALEAGLNTIGMAGAVGVNDYNKFKANERYNERVLRILKTADRRYNKNTGETEFID